MVYGKKRILVLGGGFGGAYAAQKLSRGLAGTEYELTVVDRNNYLLFYPLLVEAGVGVLEPRHVVVPVRKFMPKGDFRMAEILSIDTKLQVVQIRMVGLDSIETLDYDQLVFSLGSITRVPPIPGLKEHCFELKSLSDAIALRDRGIRLLEMANSLKSRDARRALLRIVVVGANFTGIEFAGEYQAFLQSTAKHYSNVLPEDIEVRVLELGDRILPAVDKSLSDWARETLTERGLVIQTQNSITEVGSDYVVLKSGERLATHTVLWTAGIAPNPLLSKVDGFPLNAKGYLDCERDLRVKGLDNVWAIGDSATIYDPAGHPYSATAQNASRQGALVAENILASIKGQKLKTFDFKTLGSFAIIGHRNATAEFIGMKFKGFIGWFLYRGTYLMKMPTFAMKVRLAMDWTLELLLPAAVVQLGVHRTGMSQTTEQERFEGLDA